MLGLTEPHTFELADRLMATVRTTGDPDRGADEAIRALYDSVNQLRRTKPFQLDPLRVRMPMEGTLAKSQWVSMWGLPVPADVNHIDSVDPQHPVHLDVWEYGPVAEILHEGSYAEEAPTVERLFRYMREQNYEVIGPHEEEYLTAPGAVVPKTLIRYRVKIV